MKIGQRMKERRKELKMSAEDLAKKLQKDRSTVYRYEKGDIENLPIDLLKPIADALEMTPAALMGWDVEEIEAVSSMQKDANEYENSIEQELQNFILEISEMGFDPSEIQRIRDFAHIVNKKSTDSAELHKAFVDLFIDMYKLGLTSDDLKEIYTYAQFVRSKRKDD